VDRDALRHVVLGDCPVSEALRQQRRLGRIGELAHQVVHRLTRLREAVSRQRCPPLGVVLEREGDARRRLAEHLVEQM
jgi:hypothetical protein